MSNLIRAILQSNQIIVLKDDDYGGLGFYTSPFAKFNRLFWLLKYFYKVRLNLRVIPMPKTIYIV